MAKKLTILCRDIYELSRRPFVCSLGSVITKFGRGFGRNNEPVFAVLISWVFVQVC